MCQSFLHRSKFTDKVSDGVLVRTRVDFSTDFQVETHMEKNLEKRKKAVVLESTPSHTRTLFAT